MVWLGAYMMSPSGEKKNETATDEMFSRHCKKGTKKVLLIL